MKNNFKKIVVVLIVAVLMFCLMACSLEVGTTNSSISMSSQSSSTSTDTTSLTSSSSSSSSSTSSSRKSSTTSSSSSKTQSSASVTSSSTQSSSMSLSSTETSISSISSSSSSSSIEPTPPVVEEKGESVNLRVDGGYTGTSGEMVQNCATYKTVSEAVSALVKKAYTADKIKNIQIEAGTYNEKISIPATLKNVRLIGSKTGSTTLTYGDCSDTAGGTNESASTTVLCDGFYATRINFKNSYDYIKGTNTNKQALAFLINADKAMFYQCTFWGYQDTLEIVAGRHYFYDCTVSGSVDFIFGNNPTSLFENCHIVSLKRKSDGSGGGYITAMKGNNGTNGQAIPTYGVVFKNSSLTFESGLKSGTISLGRPWRANATVTWLNCEMGAHISLKAYNGSSGGTRYVYMNGGNLKNEPQNAFFTEYGNTGSGAITSAVKGCTILTEAKAKTYTTQNIFAKTNGLVSYSSTWDGDYSLAIIKGL